MVGPILIEIEFNSPSEAHGAAQAMTRSALDLRSMAVNPALGSRKTAFVLSCLLQIGTGVVTRVAGDAIYDAVKSALSTSQSASAPSQTPLPTAPLAQVPVRLKIGSIETAFSAPAITDALEKQLQGTPP